MAKPELKFDNKLKQSEIIINLTNSSVEESGDNYKYNQPEVKQTSVYGIISPLVQINNIVINFSEIVDFSLKSTGILPSVNMTVVDKFDLIKQFDAPGNDNILRVQILPRQDNTYKKINLTFYISSVKINNGYINLTGIYKLPELTSSKIISFGEIDIYSLFEKVAIETGLGYSTNVAPPITNKKYTYCDNKSYLELLTKEISFANFENNQIFDFWIDLWNTLTFVDIYERYNTKDPEEDMVVWINNMHDEISEHTDPSASQCLAVLTNNPQFNGTDLSVSNYKVIGNGSEQVYKGTDKLYSIYSTNKYEYLDYLIQDGDVKKDIFVNYEYLGEYYGEYNYLLSVKKRADFLQKLTTESIEVELTAPFLGLMRGNQINFMWYIDDSMYKMNKENLSNDDLLEDNNPIKEQKPNYPENNDGQFMLDDNVSGQYLITGYNIKYFNKKWHHTVSLTRKKCSNKIKTE